tara:strand:+ start:597 stop:758 length:162 start_codon:yes stop_codon:yes gene_type:complete
MKIKTIKRFLKFIKGFNEEKESLARVQFLAEELDDHIFWINKESRRVRGEDQK